MQRRYLWAANKPSTLRQPLTPPRIGATHEEPVGKAPGGALVWVGSVSRHATFAAGSGGGILGTGRHR